MNRRVFATAGVAVAAGASVAAGVAGNETVAALAALGGAMVLGEALELRPADRPVLPVSFAFVLVLARVGSVAEVALTIVLAELVAALARVNLAASASAARFAHRISAALAGVLAYRWVDGAFHDPRSTTAVLLGLVAGSAAMLAVHALPDVIRRRHTDVAPTGRSAEIALITSGMLMAVGYGGLDDRLGMGLWAPLLFAIPLLAAWYSFERLDSTRRTYNQTIRALSLAPELGGQVRRGHGARVADLVVTLGRELGFSLDELEALEAAALLHHIGLPCVDDPIATGRPTDPLEVAEVGSRILRSTGELDRVADIVAAEPLPYRSPIGDASIALRLAQVLKVASAYDELTSGDPGNADAGLAVMYSAPGYVYDPFVLLGLERVLTSRSATLA
ncbi:MAG: hypothetical protein JWL73_30 [Actinomycetia bacterium]|nr:hypothetical protein [Actinomycetes bacterium]